MWSPFVTSPGGFWQSQKLLKSGSPNDHMVCLKYCCDLLNNYRKNWVVMMSDRIFHVVQKQVFVRLDGALPLWGSFITSTIFPCVGQFDWKPAAGLSVLLGVNFFSQQAWIMLRPAAIQLFMFLTHYWMSDTVMVTGSCSGKLLWSAATLKLRKIFSLPITISKVYPHLTLKITYSNLCGSAFLDFAHYSSTIAFYSHYCYMLLTLRIIVFQSLSHFQLFVTQRT